MHVDTHYHDYSAGATHFKSALHLHEDNYPQGTPSLHTGDLLRTLYALKIETLLIGTPLPTAELGEKRLESIRALAAFSRRMPWLSIAYANQEIYLGLVVAGSLGLCLAWPIGLAITTLLVIVALSYFQTIHGYPSGGGSYIVARSNLGTLPGLVAAAALLIDYLLNAAVSLTAGVAAIASAFPELWPYRW